ncbi:MAG: glycoside hydrolase family 13 protein [Cyclobacteriaceae bacterium]|nr:glycoside hydrolase family 13 protein [Cytophagales bacterium]MCZ8326900.1 glycoside hydrolase family 13 protein [Cyclobacteriaceae bacterium]
MKINIRFFSLIVCLLSLLSANAQKKKQIDIKRIEPAFWWTGLQQKEIQLLVYGTEISGANVEINYPGVVISKIEQVENPNYQFIYLKLDENVKPGVVTINFKEGKLKKTIPFELKSRSKTTYKGFNASDAIYLITPDRFANGNTANDSIKSLYQGVNRNKPFSRHGGDIQGIINQLDYIQNLGMTALWINPLTENNQPEFSYHGYAITDFYKVDARFGSNEDFKKLTDLCHQRNMKMIIDLVFNHCGNEHWFIKDLPEKNWIHQFDTFTQSNYRLATTADPHASQFDKEKMEKGWFDRHMPDLNQENPRLATYLIQNTIWWIEYLGLDGIRVDTHPYPEKNFMSRWTKTIMDQYPDFNIVGEVWEEHVLLTSYYQTNATNTDGYQGYLPSITDFPLCFAINTGLMQNDGWAEGMAKIYYALAQDFAYTQPNNNVIFLDNHDITRFATNMKGDIAKQKMGFALLATLRGIPQVYYGMEIGMLGSGDNHGTLRADFPGGWKEDKRNAFAQTGRTQEENELVNYLSKVFTWRKNANAIHNGKLMHFVPENGTYVYFRYTDTESVMVVTNNTTQEKTLALDRFKERVSGYQLGKEVVSEKTFNLNQSITIPANTTYIIELKK